MAGTADPDSSNTSVECKGQHFPCNAFDYGPANNKRAE